MATRTKKRTLTKQGLLTAIAGSDHTMTQKQANDLLERLAEVGHRELQMHGTFTVPGFAKFVVVKKKALPARVGINPFTGKKQKFKAKPASKTVRARPIKAIKDSVAKK